MIDCHCDALWKIWENQYDFHNDPRLAVNYSKWMDSNVKIQCFAIFVPPTVPSEAKFAAALQMTDIFFEKIIKPYPNVKLILNKRDIHGLEEAEKGAMLTVEGLDLIGYDLFKLRTLIRLGVRMIGLSWNVPNLVVDGIMESRGSGLTEFGRDVIQLANQERIWIDLAHASYKGFFDALEIAEYPIVSHANVHAVTQHPRNLDDQQILALINKEGLIGINFVREFVTDKNYANFEDLFLHINYLIESGLEDYIIFGSDFDGSDDLVDGLTSISDYPIFIDYLKKKLPQGVLNRITCDNFIKKSPFN
ncbi:membrane dipeptidase [Gracilibacillus ureilyticus]|uniref:Membrane dipeptidase n=1 Tax=Gracilibacillus ureilyticus TaxID=531814 RepID=A0A1H9LBP7_9BACI|nr:membrane dipeptidase [Gracilibacillus ureilyticus]SER08413.1 membrane dipeptidase [Gracilibacillus ureilyticus]